MTKFHSSGFMEIDAKLVHPAIQIAVQNAQRKVSEAMAIVSCASAAVASAFDVAQADNPQVDTALDAARRLLGEAYGELNMDSLELAPRDESLLERVEQAFGNDPEEESNRG